MNEVTFDCVVGHSVCVNVNSQKMYFKLSKRYNENIQNAIAIMRINEMQKYK